MDGIADAVDRAILELQPYVLPDLAGKLLGHSSVVGGIDPHIDGTQAATEMPGTAFGAAAARMAEPIKNGYDQLAHAMLAMSVACRHGAESYQKMDSEIATAIAKYDGGAI
ncbi:hypothetical protein [Nocardia arthritidis]|uniref:ESX-1 secretion-associated protein n=1 Tax=Nocardia arthritidis TaxID=228602 RepID=A0A6G9YBU7_9NOCA|nr:hypothetical protein [Nocardia arthritidis]QIS10610.1 hypothetical protein F5544_13610 [Nocardia arthritidis]